MWLDGCPILVGDKQVAEVIRQSGKYVIRNLRPNGTIGICFDSSDKQAITDELTKMFGSDWTKGDRHA